MHAQRKCYPIVLAVLMFGLAVSTVFWPGCTFPFFGPLTASAGSNTTMLIGQSIVLQGSATGGSGQYSYSWSPSVGLSSAAVDRPTFTPTLIGTRVFTLTVTDSSGSVATASVTITVATYSPALVANAGPDLTTAIGSPVTLQGSASGGNGQYIYAWTAPSGVILAGADAATPLFTPISAGTFAFTLTVRDTEGASATDVMSVTVSSQTTLSSLTWGANVSTGGYQVIAVFSQALSRSSAETVANYRVTGTTTTPTRASLGADNVTVTLTFNVALASVSQFDLSVGGGLIDAGGTHIPAISGRTPDRNSADTTPPSVVSATWGAVISNGYQVVIVFSEALDRTGAQTTGAYRINGTTTTAQSATLGTDGKTVTVAFTGITLTSSSRIDISVGNAIKDINANAMTALLNQAVSGTIATPTSVSSVTWGANYSAGGYQVVVVFSQALNTTTAQTVDNWRINGGTTKPTSATASADAKTVTLIFNAALAITDKLDISVGNSLKDANGNTINELLAQTISAASGDTTAPTISSVNWAANYTAGGYQIVVVFSEAMDRTSVQATTSWRINGTTTTPSSATLGTDGRTVTLIVLAPLAIADKLDVSVGGTIRDINANILAQQLGQSITAGADVTQPTVSSVNWAAHFGTGGYQVLVAFNEAMDRATAQTLVNYRINPGAANPTSATLNADGKTVALVFAGLRHIGDTLDVSVGTTVKDINNNAAAQALAQAINANTADTTGPNIASRLWKTGLTTYQADVTFSDAMDETSAEVAGSYTMTVNGGAAISPTTATLAADGVTVTLDFGNVATFKTGDLLTVSANVKNVNNRANTSTTATAMTATGGTRTAASTYVWVGPPTSYGVTLTFADVMDITSVTTTTNYTLGAIVANPSSVSALSANGRVVTLTWATGPFASSDQMTITSNVRDIAGRSLTEAVSISQNGGDATTPAVSSRVWGNGLATYTTTVTFSQVMDKTSAQTGANYTLPGGGGTGATLDTTGKIVAVTFSSATVSTADGLTVGVGAKNINGRGAASTAVPAANPGDVTGPVAQTATKINATTVDVAFNEVLDKTTAEAAAYTITGGAVTGAVLQSGGLIVRLTTTVDPTGKTVSVPTTVRDINNNPAASVVSKAVSG